MQEFIAESIAQARAAPVGVGLAVEKDPAEPVAARPWIMQKAKRPIATGGSKTDLIV